MGTRAHPQLIKEPLVSSLKQTRDPHAANDNRQAVRRKPHHHPHRKHLLSKAISTHKTSTYTRVHPKRGKKEEEEEEEDKTLGVCMRAVKFFHRGDYFLIISLAVILVSPM